MKIFLIGMPGAGKSTLGKELADHFNYHLTDLDLEIENSEGKSIPEIIAVSEILFREIEHEVLVRSVNKYKNFVMACGGGTPCFFNHMEYFRECGTSIFLDVPLDELASRIEKDHTIRPLIDRFDLQDSLATLYQKRLGCYQQADIILTGSDLTIDDLIKSFSKN